MAYKCIRKFVSVMMELLILILLKVQGNDLAHTSFYHYFSELNKVQNNIFAPNSFSNSPLPILCPELDEDQETIYTCIANKIKVCEEKQSHAPP